MKYLQYFESRTRLGFNYHSNKDKILQDFINKIYKKGKINSRYILTSYRDEFVDFLKSIKKYNKGELTKKELRIKYISFLKLLGITIPFMVSISLTLTIVLSFKKWGLERYLPDSFKKDIEEIDIDKI